VLNNVLRCSLQCLTFFIIGAYSVKRFFGVVAYSAKKRPFFKVFFNAVAYSTKDFLALKNTAPKIF
jgi:hypothetical protein